MALIDGQDFVSGDILSFQEGNRLKNHFRGSAVPASIQPGMLFSDSDDDRLRHRGAAAVEEVLQEMRSKYANPLFSEGQFKSLNIVCNNCEVVVNDDDVVFNTAY